jgi:hypothetical protein
VRLRQAVGLGLDGLDLSAHCEKVFVHQLVMEVADNALGCVELPAYWEKVIVHQLVMQVNDIPPISVDGILHALESDFVNRFQKFVHLIG